MAIDREKIHVAAQKYVEKKKYDKAVLEYQKVIQEDPNDARTLLKIGDLQSKMEDYAGAVATYERVGRYYASQGFSLKAIAVYKQIRELISRHVPQLEERFAHITPKLAELYQELGMTSDALAALDEMANKLQKQGRESEAVDVFRKLVELDAVNPLPHLRLAEALSRSRDVDGAVAQFAVAAGQLAKLGRRDDALKVLERLLQHRPDPAHARVAAELYLARSAVNDGLQALAKLQLCFQANPRDLDTLALLARAFNHIGQAAKAIEVQKEMARIARDTGRTDLFSEIIGRLLQLVPHDEGVRQLAAGSEAPPPPSAGSLGGAQAQGGALREGSARQAARSAASPVPSDDDDVYEDVGDTEIDAVEAPLADDEAQDGFVDDNSVEVVETVDDPSPQARAQIAQILEDAASLRRARLPSKAVATLRAGLRALPSAIELREVLCDVLVECGRPHEAVAEMLELAGAFVDALDVESAARVLQDALSLEPDHARASEMLGELGYELVEEGAGPTQPPALDQYTATERYTTTPSEEMRQATAQASSLAASGEEAANRRGDAHGRESQRTLEDIDDPFAPEAPLPSFPLEAPTSHGGAASLAAGRSAGRADADRFAPPQHVARVPAEGTTSAPRTGAELEAALEEADFFASRGLYEDARTILAEQVARLPNHPLLVERLAELDAQERSAQIGSGTRPSPAAGAPTSSAAVVDRAFDIAESLHALESSDTDSAQDAEAPLEQVDVEEVFAKFKEGVAKQIGVDDAQSHYDLGLAYKDMGLVDDAVREFETAARDPRHACVCQSMIGMIHLELGNVNDAIDAFSRGLHASERTKEQEAALSYELGSAYEVKKMNRQALDYFQRAARVIPGFRDVVERVRRLQKTEPKQPARAVAVGADDEFDRAFDDILGKRT